MSLTAADAVETDCFAVAQIETEIAFAVAIGFFKPALQAGGAAHFSPALDRASEDAPLVPRAEPAQQETALEDIGGAGNRYDAAGHNKRRVRPLAANDHEDLEYLGGFPHRFNHRFALKWLVSPHSFVEKRQPGIGGIYEIGSKCEKGMTQVALQVFDHERHVAYPDCRGGRNCARDAVKSASRRNEMGAGADSANARCDHQRIQRCAPDEDLFETAVEGAASPSL